MRSPLLGTSLVVGGCGCVGYHIVRHLLSDPEAGPVHVLDINITNNTIDSPSVTYHKGNITDIESVRSIIRSVKPTVLFHCASPIASHKNEKLFYDVNITGTKILLDVAKQEGVIAFVFTSTVDVYYGAPHIEVEEDNHLIKGTTAYTITKAAGDQMALHANDGSTEDGGMKTVSIRPGHIYGERHIQGLHEVLDTLDNSSPLVKIGNGKNYMEVVSVDNVAAIHLLAAKALVDPENYANGKVDGEAFNVADGNRVHFWHHIGVIWSCVRGPDAAKNAVIIPAWVILTIVVLVEWLLWLFTLGLMKPPLMLRRESIVYCIYDHTYSTKKAKERLGYVPKDDHDVVMAECVRWEMRRRGMKIFGGEEQVKS